MFDESWHDFAYNRSTALARLQKNRDVDYVLVMDADDVLVPEEGFDVARFKESLSEDLYNVELRSGLVRYHRPQICNNRREFR